jgi:prepilin-type processing-associated H-X9-DG protein
MPRASRRAVLRPGPDTSPRAVPYQLNAPAAGAQRKSSAEESSAGFPRDRALPIHEPARVPPGRDRAQWIDACIQSVNNHTGSSDSHSLSSSPRRFRARDALSCKGEEFLNENCGEGGCFSHIQPPNKKACIFNGDGLHTSVTIIGASSNHSGGLNAGFLDGSVHFIKSSIAPATWWAIATKAGGEVISADSL